MAVPGQLGTQRNDLAAEFRVAFGKEKRHIAPHAVAQKGGAGKVVLQDKTFEGIYTGING